MKLKEYKELKIEDLVLPSSLEIRIQRLYPIDILTYFQSKKINLEKINEMSFDKFLDIIVELIIEISLKPKIVSKNPKEGELSLKQITPEDFSYLVDKVINEVNGFSNSFRVRKQ